MAEVRYVFGNLLTGEVLEEIPMQGVTIDDSVEGGQFQGTFSLDQTGRNNDELMSATLPGLRYVVVERDDVPFWCGIVWSRTYQSQAKSAQLYAKTMDQYLSRRFIESDLTWVDTEQRNIFRELWLDMQAAGYAPPIIIPPAFSTQTLKSLTITAAEMKTYRDAVDELATAENGFEWRVVVSRTSGAYTFSVVAGGPSLGQPLGDNSVVFEYPGPILNYWRNDTIASSGTNIFGIGAGEGESMPVVEVVHDLLLQTGWPRWDYQVSFKDISDATRIATLTQKQAALRKAPMPIYTVEMSANQEPRFTDWSVGDGCQLVINDPAHEGGTTYTTRILKYEYTPPSADAVEEVRLTFEGDEGE